MQETVFRIYESENKQMIERLIYPKFTAEITFNSEISDLENITLDEDVWNASDIAEAMRETADFILENSKE
jgi:hypothetical protein